MNVKTHHSQTNLGSLLIHVRMVCFHSSFIERNFLIFTLGGLWIFNLFCMNCLSPKIISCILFSKFFWINFLNYGCFTKSLSNINCPTCLTNPSLISLSIYGHSVITCLFTSRWKHIGGGGPRPPRGAPILATFMTCM
jgi:hypothetical protein